MAVFKSKIATRNGRKWYFSACYMTANGERRRKKSGLYATKGEAQEAERTFLTTKTYDVMDITFEKLYHQYMEYSGEIIKGSTKYQKNNLVKNHLLSYFGMMKIHNINVNTVIAWKSKINKITYKGGKKYTVSYKRNLFAQLGAILRYAVRFCELKENVASKIGTFQNKTEEIVTDEDKIRYITPDEYNLFTSVINNIVHKVFFAFLYYMGVRKGEAQALNWQDIFWNTSQVRIVKTITTATDELDENGKRFKITNTKNRKNRTIKMPSVLKDMLLELQRHYQEYEGYDDKWFVFGGHRHLNSNTIHNSKNKYFKLVQDIHGKSINKITTHEFRHSHASYLMSKGVRIESIANRLGDTSEVVLKVYAHLFPETEDDIIETLESMETKCT